MTEILKGKKLYWALREVLPLIKLVILFVD